MTHPTRTREFKGCNCFSGFYLRYFWGMPQRWARKIRPHVLWSGAVRHPKGPCLCQLAKLHWLAKPKPRPLVPKKKSMPVIALPTTLALGPLSFPRGCSPPCSNVSQGGRADGSRFHKEIPSFGFLGYRAPRVSSAQLSPLVLKKSNKQLQNANTENPSDSSSCADCFLLQSGTTDSIAV